METKDYFTLIFSSVAISISLATLLLKGPENRRLIRNQLTDTLNKLITLNFEAAKIKLDSEKLNFSDVRRHSGFYNDQRTFLVGQALFLADQIPKFVTDIEYSFIARSLGESGDHERTIKYWGKCISAAKDDRSRGLGKRGIAAYLFEQSDFESGRRQFEESVIFCNGDSDTHKLTRGDTYLRWANIERDAGFVREAERLYDKAKVSLESIGSLRLKRQWLESLSEAMKGMGDKLD